MQEKLPPYTGYNTALLPRSRRLRRDMTPQERRLWYRFLRTYPVKFYKQRSIDRFIVDFYCDRAKLVVELDGGQHFTDEGEEYDTARTAVLQGYGVEVIRFDNRYFDKNFANVCQLIELKVNERLQAFADADERDKAFL